VKSSHWVRSWMLRRGVEGYPAVDQYFEWGRRIYFRMQVDNRSVRANFRGFRLKRCRDQTRNKARRMAGESSTDCYSSQWTSWRLAAHVACQPEMEMLRDDIRKLHQFLVWWGWRFSRILLDWYQWRVDGLSERLLRVDRKDLIFVQILESLWLSDTTWMPRRRVRGLERSVGERESHRQLWTYTTFSSARRRHLRAMIGGNSCSYFDEWDEYHHNVK